MTTEVAFLPDRHLRACNLIWPVIFRYRTINGNPRTCRVPGSSGAAAGSLPWLSGLLLLGHSRARRGARSDRTAPRKDVTAARGARPGSDTPSGLLVLGVS